MDLSWLSSSSETETEERSNFIVDYFEDGSDFVYHIYPNPVDQPFIENFHILLEEAFKSVLPSDADVRATFIDNIEMKYFERTQRPQDNPYESFWVRVIGLNDKPMASHFLTNKIFNALDEHTES